MEPSGDGDDLGGGVTVEPVPELFGAGIDDGVDLVAGLGAAFIALRRAIRRRRIASTVPVAVFGVPTASPACTARAALIASAVSDLP